uniref:Uncharacterized protein n=1 Tax=Rhizophora mucronata TaxID=61149 RepID=A0A2P2NSM3_RHIMU
MFLTRSADCGSSCVSVIMLFAFYQNMHKSFSGPCSRLQSFHL